jgi:hypothetical protein
MGCLSLCHNVPIEYLYLYISQGHMLETHAYTLRPCALLIAVVTTVHVHHLNELVTCKMFFTNTIAEMPFRVTLPQFITFVV